MSAIAMVGVGVVAVIHIYILYLEMFLWTKPAGLRAFGLTQAAADSSKILAANQGLYNGFLAAGLLWSLYLGSDGVRVALFFLGCVTVAGLFGAATASRKILYVQTVPAVIAVGLVLIT